MPIPTSPPYAPAATTSPRQLNKWLDVNAQNGPLTRTRTYLIVPAFSVAANWRGYSSIVGEFTHSAPNNFSLQVNPASYYRYPHYTLCVSYIADGVVYRYRLFTSYDSLFYFDIPQYNGEMIGAEFKFEIWSAATVTITQVNPITIYTSVMNAIDYRYGDDTLLVANNGLCTGEQSEVDGSATMPMPLRFGICTFNYGPATNVELLGNQIKEIITDESGNTLSM